MARHLGRLRRPSAHHPLLLIAYRSVETAAPERKLRGFLLFHALLGERVPPSPRSGKVARRPDGCGKQVSLLKGLPLRRCNATRIEAAGRTPPGAIARRKTGVRDALRVRSGKIAHRS